MMRASTWMAAPLLLALLACKGASKTEGRATESTDPKTASATREADAVVPASTRAASGPLALSVIEGRAGVEDTGFLHIVGLIRNDGPKWIESPKVDIVLLDADGKPIGVDSIAAADGHGESAYGMRHNVPPGEVSPFHYIRDVKKLARPYASHKLAPRAFPSDARFDAKVVDVKLDKELIGKTEYWRFSGSLKNTGKPCINPQAVVALYDAAGKLVDTRSGLTEWDVKNEWPSDASLAFKTGPVDTRGLITSSKVWGDCHEPW